MLYRCDVGPKERQFALLAIPWPRSVDLCRLHAQKQRYRSALNPAHRRSNVRVVVRWGDRDREDWPPQAFTLLLAFYEAALGRVLAQSREAAGESIFDADPRRLIPDGWVLLRIPQDRMKDITVADWFMEDPILQVLRALVQENILPYQKVLTGMWRVQEGKPPDPNITAEWREAMAAAFLQNDYGRFACGFRIRGRESLGFYMEAVQGLHRWLQSWLKERGTMNEQDLELIRRAGRTIGRIAGSQRRSTILYGLERARTPSDLLEVLSEIIHRLVGMEAQAMREQYLSLEALDRLTALIHATGDDARRFADIKHTLFIYAGLEYAGVVRAAAEASAQ
ncbi:MAG: hypothetical protein C4312_01685 [Thermoflexus sp.]